MEDKQLKVRWAGWCMSLIPEIGQKLAELCCIPGQPGLLSEFEDSQGCHKEKPSLEEPEKKAILSYMLC